MTRAVLLLLLAARLALAASASEFDLPTVTDTTAVGVRVANELRCVLWQAPFALTNGTKLACPFPGGVAASTGGCAVYPNGDASTVLATCSGSTAAAGVVTCTGLTAFSLVAGTTYRVCVCGTSTSIQYLALDGGTGAGQYASLTNASATFQGIGANACTAGAPPSTTGALTAVTIGGTERQPPVVRVGGGS